MELSNMKFDEIWNCIPLYMIQSSISVSTLLFSIIQKSIDDWWVSTAANRAAFVINSACGTLESDIIHKVVNRQHWRWKKKLESL